MTDFRRQRRAAVAITLALAAVIVPASAWLVVGQSAARSQAEVLREEPHRRGEAVARELADRLRGRLEAIRDAESQRPVSQFQVLAADDAAACDCSVHGLSPLLTGPQDPFAEGYFEITPQGNLSMPILESGPGFDPDPDRYQRAWELAPQLRAAIPEIHYSLDTESKAAELAEPNFQWHGIELGRQPSLVALREAKDARGISVQGFVLSAAAVRSWLAAAELPATLAPARESPDPTVATGLVPLDCTSWEIAVGLEPATAEADARAAAVLAGFWRNFSIGAGAALLAAISLVAMILNTERQARDRAQFAASAAHELRTPLTGLRLYGEMLRDGIDDPARVARYAGRIAEESERLSRVVTNVLGFTRLERGTLEISTEDCDPIAILHGVAGRLGPTLVANGAVLEIDTAGFTGTLRADPEAVAQIIQNLVDNAEKYSREATDRKIRVQLRRDDQGVVIVVQDQGPGIAPALVGKLFAPFTRGTAPDQPAGLGLGLALASELAQVQQAQLRYLGNDGEHTRFELRFAAIT